MGYSLSFVLIKAEEQYGWRAVYYISGVPGIVLGVIMLLTVKEPTRGGQEGSNAVSSYVLLVSHSQCKQTLAIAWFIYDLWIQCSTLWTRGKMQIVIRTKTLAVKIRTNYL